MFLTILLFAAGDPWISFYLASHLITWLNCSLILIGYYNMPWIFMILPHFLSYTMLLDFSPSCYRIACGRSRASSRRPCWAWRWRWRGSGWRDTPPSSDTAPYVTMVTTWCFIVVTTLYVTMSTALYINMFTSQYVNHGHHMVYNHGYHGWLWFLIPTRLPPARH